MVKINMGWKLGNNFLGTKEEGSHLRKETELLTKAESLKVLSKKQKQKQKHYA